MSVDQIRAALETIDATPPDGFLAELEQQLLATWTGDAQLAANDVPVGVAESGPLAWQHRRRWMMAAAAAVVVLALGLFTVVAVQDPDSIQTNTVPPTPAPSTVSVTTAALPPVESSLDPLPAPTSLVEEPSSVFSGSWISTDTDGSVQTVALATSVDQSVHMALHDSAASRACANAGADVTGSGELDSGGDLVVTLSKVTCDDGSAPSVSVQDLGSYIFSYDSENDRLTDNFGVVWSRAGADQASVAPLGWSGMWPQSSIDEVSDAQALADAGDPTATWQIDPRLSSQEWWSYLRQPGAPIAERFLRDELGWEQFLFNPWQPEDGTESVADGIRPVVYLRCSPGETNPWYPIAEQGDALGADRCAPTIDERRYEAVRLDLWQPDRRGPEGIWVVSRWMVTAPFAQADPRLVETRAAGRLEEFLSDRVEGSGAEGYVDVFGHGSQGMTEDVPLLYATTNGARYERFEIERGSEPRWPYGDMEFTVRLFANGGETIVEQQISVLQGRLTHDAAQTKENGQPVAAPYMFYDGEVTVSAPDPWNLSPFFESALAFGDQSGDARVELVRNPLPIATGCAPGPVPSDADALVRSIRSNPDLVVSAPVSVDLGGASGSAIDVTVAPGASVCETFPATLVLTQGDGYSGPRPPGVDLAPGSRMRLYLLDVPERLPTPILAIAVVAPEARFEDLVEGATPILESLQFGDSAV
jgi:hypothetical protein